MLTYLVDLLVGHLEGLQGDLGEERLVVARFVAVLLVVLSVAGPLADQLLERQADPLVDLRVDLRLEHLGDLNVHSLALIANCLSYYTQHLHTSGW